MLLIQVTILEFFRDELERNRVRVEVRCNRTGEKWRHMYAGKVSGGDDAERQMVDGKVAISVLN